LFEASGIDDKKCYLETIHPDKSLGVFIRELVGMDRNAAKEAFAEYLDESRFNSQQIRFVNTIIDFLTSNGVMSPAQLAQPPFSDIHFEGVFGLFEDEDVSNLTGSIKKIGEAVLVAERS
ncbi:MAG: restriction endonuclease subunit R, partial [Candidatus Thiodiazotropha taylori]|nr:restriction endonuclease subunit R [Candidatus Thiodiazotropha taylori]MCW4290524.1 restriction endonuclease subunit R [Candidatus Thiodiazotropha taylori]